MLWLWLWELLGAAVQGRRKAEVEHGEECVQRLSVRSSMAVGEATSMRVYRRVHPEPCFAQDTWYRPVMRGHGHRTHWHRRALAECCRKDARCVPDTGNERNVQVFEVVLYIMMRMTCNMQDCTCMHRVSTRGDSVDRWLTICNSTGALQALQAPIHCTTVYGRVRTYYTQR